ncbi:MAG: RNA pseudouridine synthase [Pseudomonadales bacterium]
MLEVLHRDTNLAVLNKPAGISLLADRSGASCLWDALPEALQAKPFLVHRLDKGTSGVLLIALNQATQSRLTRMFQRHEVRKYYIAWVQGQLASGRTRVIDLPLRKGRKSRYRVAGERAAITETQHGWRLAPGSEQREGHPSRTRLRVLASPAGRCLVALNPCTGRTHQLRVHLAWIGHPILGDHLYGRPGAPDQQASRLLLHCHRLVVPGFGSFSARVPDGAPPSDPSRSLPRWHPDAW